MPTCDLHANLSGAEDREREPSGEILRAEDQPACECEAGVDVDERERACLSGRERSRGWIATSA